ncbi:Rgg/GadR/MutR family transcriptional regulator [Enterococcus casseliflavus]|uniref:helix-turn-helix domain-containing protein n=1 Tax=Enterococcus casseliflavus TaxID=37734 RepID=UPI0032E3FDCC
MYGETIRQIRLKKGFTQKEVYGTIISKSYAIEFEKGKHQIAANLLLQILENLSMDIDEFLYIANGYRLDEQNSYNHRYTQYSNKHDINQLQILLQELQQTSSQLNKVRIAEVRSRIRMLQCLAEHGVYRKRAVLECDRQTIISYLVDVESWTLQEIQLFGNTIDLLDNDHNFLFFKKVSKMLEYYIDMEKGREIYCALLINLIEYTLKHQQYDATEVLVVQLKLLATGYKEFFHQTVCKFFQGVLLLRTGDKKAGKTITTKMLAIMRELDQEALADDFALLLDEDYSRAFASFE